MNWQEVLQRGSILMWVFNINIFADARNFLRSSRSICFRKFSSLSSHLKTIENILLTKSSN